MSKQKMSKQKSIAKAKVYLCKFIRYLLFAYFAYSTTSFLKYLDSYCYTKVKRSGENLRCHAGEKLEDFETHFRINPKWC
jgi:hypothetical protein